MIQAQAAFALPNVVSASLPQGAETAVLAIPRQQLLKGHMLLIDEDHPLPADWLPTDSASILQAASGRVACRDTSAVLGQDAIAALSALFEAARAERIIQLTVFGAARSPEQQRQWQTDTFAALARDMSLEDALAQTRRLTASPGCSEHQTGWAVDIRVCPRWNAPPEDAPLNDSAAGRWLLEHAWEYGFIHQTGSCEAICQAYHFRYVGRAHAALMHALDVDLPEYLSLLHEHGTLTLHDKNGAPLASAVCAAAGERQTVLHLPVNASIEDVSLDNLGWTVAGCLYSADGAPEV